MHHESLAETISGSRQLWLQYQKLNVSVKEIKRGMVTCDNKNDLPKEAQYFTAQVITMNHLGVIHFGYSPVLDCYTAHIARMFSARKGKIETVGNIKSVKKDNESAGKVINAAQNSTKK
jgi:elongation factor 1-alpha